MDRILVRFLGVLWGLLAMISIANQLFLWSGSEMSLSAYFIQKWTDDPMTRTFVVLDDAVQEQAARSAPPESKLLMDALEKHRKVRTETRRSVETVSSGILIVLGVLVFVPVFNRIVPGNAIDRFIKLLDRDRMGLTLDSLPRQEREAILEALGVVRWYLNQICPLFKDVPKKAVKQSYPLARLMDALCEMPRILSVSGIAIVEPDDTAHTRVGRLKQALSADRKRLMLEVSTRQENLDAEVAAALERSCREENEFQRNKRAEHQRLTREVQELEERRKEISEALDRAAETIRQAKASGESLVRRESAVSIREAEAERAFSEAEQLRGQTVPLLERVDAGCQFMGERLAVYLEGNKDVAARVLASLQPVPARESV